VSCHWNQGYEAQHYLSRRAKGRAGKPKPRKRIRIEKDTALNWIESLLVRWLGAWSLFAGFEFLRPPESWPLIERQ
jgi:hypothetical protein